MKYRKIVLLVISVLLILTSCSADDGTNYIFKSVIYGNPYTLDPQTSYNDSSVTVISNVFQGLYRYGNKGEIEPAMAEKCEVSDDGLVWTFTLKDNVYWYDGEFSAKCTAHDFVFAFRRLMNPALKSKRASEYYCIKNAKEINSGRISDITMLGVEALGERVVRFTLAEPNSEFTYLLANSPAMPCNEEFYMKTEGQYGLNAGAIASNGNFYVTTWKYDKWSDNSNYIVLRRNAKNAEFTEISPYGLNFFIDYDGFTEFKGGEIHCYTASGIEEIDALKNGYRYETYENAVWGFVFNNKKAFSSLDLRIALGSCVKPEFDGEFYTDAFAIIPPSTDYNGELYRDSASHVSIPKYPDTELYGRYENGVSEVGVEALSGLRIIMPENDDIRDMTDDLLQTWQKNYGFYCAVSELPSDEYGTALENGDFDIAIVRLSGDSGTPSGYLSCFRSDSADNHAGFRNRKFDHILDTALLSSDYKSSVAYYTEAEQQILDSFQFVPICYEKEYVFYSDGVSEVEYNPFNGVFYYKNALKK